MFFQKPLNFTYTLKKPKTGFFGSMNKNGTWTTGLIGALNNRECDMGKGVRLTYLKRLILVTSDVLGCIHLLNTRKYCDNTRKYCGNTHEY